MTDAPILTRDLLIASFQDYGQPAARWRVGGEFERVVVRRDGRPVSYEGADGIRAILEHLRATDASWAPVFVLGLGAAWLVERTGWLLPAMVAHAVYNAIVLCWLQ